MDRIDEIINQLHGNVSDQQKSELLDEIEGIARSNEKSTKYNAEVEREFNAFWSLYPKKVSKGAAKKAFVSVRRKGVTLNELLAGVIRYQDEVKFKDRDYIKHAATWLHAECWADEQEQKAENVVRMRR